MERWSRLRPVAENAKDYILVVSDADDRITDWLGTSEDILGWSGSLTEPEKKELYRHDVVRTTIAPHRYGPRDGSALDAMRTGRRTG